MKKDIRLLLQTDNRAMQCAFGIYTGNAYTYDEEDDDDVPGATEQKILGKGEPKNAGKDSL